MSRHTDQLQQKIDQLNDQMTALKLLEDIWRELGPYTPHLPTELLIRLQQHFDFDDSE